jgi:hypothetical protein
MAVDGRAVGIGAAVAFLVALPWLVLGIVLDVPAFALLVIVGFVVGGGIAGTKRPDAPYTHGLLAAAAASVATSAVSIAMHSARDDDVDLASYAFNLVVAAACGCLGALIAQRRRT